MSHGQPKNKLKIPFLKYPVDRTITAAYCLSTLYNVAFFLQMFLLPFISKSNGCSDRTFGYIQTLFGLLQMGGGPLFGYIIQFYGVRNALVVCYISSMISAICLYYSQDTFGMLLSRIPCVLMHGQQAHQSLLAGLTKSGKQRTKAFGRLGLTFGLGFVFTPLISKLTSLGGLGERAPLLSAAGVCLLSLAILHFHVPNEKEANDANESVGAEKEAAVVKFDFSVLMLILRRRNVLNVICQKTVAVSPALLIFAVLQLDLINRFSISAGQNSLLQVFTGLNLMLTNTLGISWLRSKFQEPALVRLGLIAFIFTYTQFCWFYHLWQIAMIMFGIAFSMTLVGTVADSILTSAVEPEEQGIVLGITTSTNSLVRTFAPAMGGYLLESYGIGSLGLLGSLATAAALLLHLVHPITKATQNSGRKPTDSSGTCVNNDSKEETDPFFEEKKGL